MKNKTSIYYISIAFIFIISIIFIYENKDNKRWIEYFRLNNILNIFIVTKWNKGLIFSRNNIFTVNEKKVNIPSYQIKPGDKVSFKESSKKKTFFDTVTQTMGSRTVPDWLQCDNGDISGVVLKMPEVTGTDIGIDTRLIVEYYSRR